MKNKILYVTMTLVLMILLSGVAFGAFGVTLDQPAASGLVQGTYNLNATVDYTNTVDLTNVTWKAFCTDSANTTYTVLVRNSSAANFSDSATVATGWTSTLIEDSASCTFQVVLTNSSGTNVSDTSTSVNVDNTVPTAPTSITATATDKSSVPITATVTGAQTTSCTIQASSPTYSKVPVAMTHSGNTCTYTFSNEFSSSGDFTLKVIASDGTNVSVTTQQLKINQKGGGGMLPGSKKTSGIESQDGPLSGSDGGKWIVIIIGVWFVGNQLGWFGKKK